MAKLAVLISIPRKNITHCPRSLAFEETPLGGRRGCDELDPQGVFLSERRTPFSRASCSRVIGMKEPRWTELACIRTDQALKREDVSEASPLRFKNVCSAVTGSSKTAVSPLCSLCFRPPSIVAVQPSQSRSSTPLELHRMHSPIPHITNTSAANP